MYVGSSFAQAKIFMERYKPLTKIAQHPITMLRL